jgi:hypothetical protein
VALFQRAAAFRQVRPRPQRRCSRLGLRTKIIDCFQALVRLVSGKAAGFFGAKSSLSRRDIHEARRLFQSRQICVQSCKLWFSCSNHSHVSSYFDRIYSAFERGGVLGICCRWRHLFVCNEMSSPGEAAGLFPPNMTHTSRDRLKWACVPRTLAPSAFVCRVTQLQLRCYIEPSLVIAL